MTFCGEQLRSYSGAKRVKASRETPEVGHGSSGWGAQQALKLGANRLDWIEARTVGQKVEELPARCLKGLAHADHPLGLQVVEDQAMWTNRSARTMLSAT